MQNNNNNIFNQISFKIKQGAKLLMIMLSGLIDVTHRSINEFL